MSVPQRKIKPNSVDILIMNSNIDVEESPGNSRNTRGDQNDGEEAQGRKILINSLQVFIVWVERHDLDE